MASGSAGPDRDDDAGAVAARLRDAVERAHEDAARMQREYDEMLADPDVIQEDRDTAALLLEHARRQVDSAQAAVDQLEAGEYGRCITCGGDIGRERLAALVDVTTCVNCAE